MASQHILLKKEIKPGEITDPMQLVDTTITSIEGAEFLLSEIRALKQKKRLEEERSIRAFERTFPPLEPQRELESEEDFITRNRLYHIDKLYRHSLLTFDSTEYVTAIALMEEWVDSLGDIMTYTMFPIDTLTILPYKIKKKSFLCYFQMPFHKEHKISYRGYLHMSPEEASIFKASIAERKKLLISHSRKKTDIKWNSKTLQVYYKYDKVMVLFRGKQYKLTGRVSLRNEIKSKVKTELIRYDNKKRRRGAQTYGMKRVSQGTIQCGPLPTHQCTVSSFWMDSSEVSQREYERLMNRNPSHFKGKDSRPVENLTWIDAALYCNARSKELELEPFYKIRMERKHYNGDPYRDSYTIFFVHHDEEANGFRLPYWNEWLYARDITDEMNRNRKVGEDFVQTGPTDSTASGTPNMYGLYNMKDNVWEWCEDWHSNRIASSVKDLSSTPYKEIPEKFKKNERSHHKYLGFRCVIPILPEEKTQSNK